MQLRPIGIGLIFNSGEKFTLKFQRYLLNKLNEKC